MGFHDYMYWYFHLVVVSTMLVLKAVPKSGLAGSWFWCWCGYYFLYICFRLLYSFSVLVLVSSV